ncbi:CoxG family protein [Halomarina halobia]|uniref:CoxG family protein n=1 Tax=Halomarina halobia TaxID=3033386 RepID=A0ABD6ABT6_9EURY|nr:SRPBCC family protein [Halomarina sp. PSR21]
MTVRVERTFELDAAPDDVWAFISDPEKRARPISVVTDFETTGERTARWHVELPIPLVKRTIAVDTRETTVEPPRYVRFVGRSKVMRVVGEHELEPTEGGTRLTNRFVVDGRLPGVERFFKRNLDAELDNLEAAIREDLGPGV